MAFLAAVTLLPAIITLAGPRGWIAPRRELTARWWRRSGVRIVRRPVAHLVASMLVLGLLASSAALATYNYDDRKAVPASAPSSVGYAALDRHFDINQLIPSYVLVRSPRDLRSPQALADLEQMASRISQLPDIAMVSGITRPLGVVPKEFRATYQAGLVGDRLSTGAAVIGDNMADLNRLASGADTLATNLGMSAVRSARWRPASRPWWMRSRPSRASTAATRWSRTSRWQPSWSTRSIGWATRWGEFHRRPRHVRLGRPGAGGTAWQRGVRPRPVLRRDARSLPGPRRRPQ